MIYSKVLKHSNYFVGSTLNCVRFSQKNELSHILNKHSRVFWGANVCWNNCQFSTVLKPKFSQKFSPPALKCASSLNFTAFLSADANAESYKIVVTNPSEGTSTTLNSFVTADEIKSVGEISVASPDITDIATNLTEEIASVANVVEPSLSSLGLCSPYTPVGWLEMLLEYVHVSMHWPWWLTVVSATVAARILLFPLLVKTQRNAINMSNYMPQIQYLQTKFSEARRTGNSMEASKIASELMMFMKDKKVSPMKSAMLPMMQAPVFLSFFMGLRAMAKAPVESMKDGGLWWVTDMTIPDPYYILPLIASGTLYVVLKVGAESGVRMDTLKLAKYFVRALPFIAFPFCINFPSAILYYWCTNNVCTLLIVSVLKIKPVREYFNLPTQQPIDPRFALPKKGFVKGFKDAFEDQKALSVIEERRRVDEVRFQKAGTGPIPRTYSYDPTKPRPSNVASTASKAFVAKDRKV